MIKSMTGYGRGEAELHGRTITVELRAVNNRHLDCAVKIPRAYLFVEETIKAKVQGSVSRGKVDVFVSVERAVQDIGAVTLNEALAEGYVKALGRLCERFGLSDDRSAATIARFPDVLAAERGQEDLDEFSADLTEVLGRALGDFDAMRRREGAVLHADIVARVAVIEALAAQIAERGPVAVAEYRARLEAKMKEILQNLQLDENRIIMEAAIFADKTAVDEELVRLRSHFAQLRQMLDAGGAIGRKLDFLLQECNREVNTIGSKCSDLDTTRLVVEMKAELEKIREQIQNIE